MKKIESQNSDKKNHKLINDLNTYVNDTRDINNSNLIQNKINGIQYSYQNALIIDELITKITDHLKPNFIEDGLSIIAIGGYGRYEMAPFSDIDILFLYGDKIDEEFLSQFLNIIWSLGLKIGYSVRNLTETADIIKSDHLILTSLLENRLIQGSTDQFQALQELLIKHIDSVNSNLFIADKLTERSLRHKKMGDTRYHLEPNIKESKGSLRDIHSLNWIRSYLKIAGMELDKLNKIEQAKLDNAYEFMVKLRCHLHLLSNRDNNRINFELQPDLAIYMGYKKPKKGQSHAEKMMKEYFLHARNIGYLTNIICSELEEKSIGLGSTKGYKKLIIDESKLGNFVINNGRISFNNKNHIKDNPTDILKIFYISQILDIPIHIDSLRDISRADINEELLYNNGHIFIDILTHENRSADTLRHMNEIGLLGKLMPEFKKIIGHMQYDMYHVFTVDEHLIHAVDLMHKIENSEQNYLGKLTVSINNKKLIYMAIFLHDIAKGRDGDHSDIGSDIANTLCPKIGFKDGETDLISWLIKHHLLMTKTAFKHDINDIEIVKKFCGEVKSISRLKYLYILTIVDIMAVGPNRFTDWKAKLLSDLYDISIDFLSGKNIQKNKQNLIQDKISKLNNSDYLTKNAPDNYWLNFKIQEIEEHIEKLSNSNIFEIKHLDKEYSEIIVHAKDEIGLFNKITYGFIQNQANIIDAKIFTLKNGYALDSFKIQNQQGFKFNNIDRLIKKLNIIIKDSSPLSPIAPINIDKNKFGIINRVTIDNSLSNNYTIIEITSINRIGLLFDITDILQNLKLQINSAKISSYGAKAVDVFYIKDIFGLKIINEQKLDMIKQNLLEKITDTV